MSYRCEAASVEGFVQQLACNLVNKGYWYYVVGEVPARKDTAAVDRKLIDMYKLDQSKWARARRKAKGLANVAYLRYDRFFVLIGTDGDHALFEREGAIRDIRRQPIDFQGYSIGCGKGSDGKLHASVKVGRDAFEELRSYLTELALHRTNEMLAQEFQSSRFEPFARVRRQFQRILREVNERRREAGFDPVSREAVRWRRQIVKVFEDSA